jgi:hypothetical protein
MSQPNRSAVKCPACGLTLSPRVPILLPCYCPRCLVRKQVAVELQQEPRGDAVSRGGATAVIGLDQPAALKRFGVAK